MRQTAAQLAWLVWFCIAPTSHALAMDYLAYWTDESEFVIIGRVSQPMTLSIREKVGKQWSDYRPGKVFAIQVDTTLKGSPAAQLFCWAEGSVPVDSAIALIFLDTYNGATKSCFEYLDSQGVAKPLLNISAGDGRGFMPIVQGDGGPYVLASQAAHLPSYVLPSGRRARLENVLDAIQRRVHRIDKLHPEQ